MIRCGRPITLIWCRRPPSHRGGTVGRDKHGGVPRDALGRHERLRHTAFARRGQVRARRSGRRCPLCRVRGRAQGPCGEPSGRAHPAGRNLPGFLLQVSRRDRRLVQPPKDEVGARFIPAARRHHGGLTRGSNRDLPTLGRPWTNRTSAAILPSPQRFRVSYRVPEAWRGAILTVWSRSLDLESPARVWYMWTDAISALD